MRIIGGSGCESCGSSSPAHSPVTTPTAASQPRSAGRVSAQAAESTKAELSLTTADGDKVTLSIASGTGAAIDAEATGDYRSLSRVSSTEVRVEVEGSLSEAELQDIRKLARIVTRASSDVLRGDTSKAAARVEKAADLDSIQSFAFSLNKQVDYRYNYEA